MATLLYGLAEAALWSSLLIVFVFVIRKPVVRYFGAKWSYALWLLPALKMMILVTPQTQLSLLPSWQTILYNFNMQQGVYALLQNKKPLTASEALFKQIHAENTVRIEAMKTATQERGSTFPAERPSEQSISPKDFPSSAPVGGWPVFSQVQIDGVTIIFFVWLGGFVMMGLVTILRHVRLYEQLLEEKREPSPEIKILLAQLCLKMGLKFQGDVFVSARIQGPAVIGWLHPKLVLPLHFAKFYSKREMELILAHELAHLQRKDFLFTAWALALKCIYWFNPLIYLAYPLFRLDQELACDQLVLTSVAPEERKSYGLTILKTLSQPEMMLEHFQAGCFWFTFSQMKERIAMINHHRISKGRSMLALISMIVLGFTALTFAASDMVKDPSTGKMVTAPAYGGTITFASKIPPPNFDSLFHPWAMFGIGGVVETLAIVNWGIDRNELDIRSPVFRPLFAMKGQLAESWSQPDPLTIILNIRQGVHWHNKTPMNGRELTAKDVEYNLHRAFGLGSGFTAENKPPILYWPWAGEPVESITATDKWTVVIKLKEPRLGLLLQFLDHFTQYVLPPEVIEQYGDMKDWRNVVGTGPYELTDYLEGSSTTWTKNPDYWGTDEKYPQNRLPYIDEISTLIMKEEATYIAALRSGRVDIIGYPGGTVIQSTDQVESLQRTNPEIELWPFAYRSNTAYAVETTKPPFSDIRVRKAMQMALDHETINNTFYNGYGLWKPQGRIGDGVVGYNTPFEEWPEALQQEYTYNPKRAEELLDEAGYPRGADGVRFKTDVVHSVVHQDVDYTELVVGYWAKIGVEVAIDVVDAPTYAARVSSGHDFEGLAWTVSGLDYPNVLGSIRPFSVQGMNLPGGMNPAYEALYEAVVAAQTIEEQQRAVKEANMYIVENHLLLWGTKVPEFNASWPWVKGYNGETTLDGANRMIVFARLWIDQELKKEMGF